MIIKDKDRNIEVIHITVDLYNYYQKMEREFKTIEYYLEDARECKFGFRDALYKIYCYNGNNEEALKLKEIAKQAINEFNPVGY
jgi:hypothetical protein